MCAPGAFADERHGVKFSCITPLAKVEASLRKTLQSVSVQSVLKQGHEVEYVIRCKDLHSEQMLLDEVERVPAKEGLRIKVVAAPDGGLYDALASAWRESLDADVYCYLGAGDYLSEHAFEIVAEVMSEYSIDWLTGLVVSYNCRHHLLEARLPFRYRRSLLVSGIYGTTLPPVQQESTFWSAAMMRYVDLDRLSTFRYAGDFYLWRTFAAHAELYVVKAWLGGFEVRPGQLSERYRREYLDELKRCAQEPTWLDRLAALGEWLVWKSPDWIVRALTTRLLYFDERSGRYQLK